MPDESVLRRGSSRLHLLEVASHGYLAIAPGQVLNGPDATGSAAPLAGPANGAGQVPPPQTQASDPGVSVIMNSGIFAAGEPPLAGVSVGKDDLASIQVPILYVLGGPEDIAYANGMDDSQRIDELPVAVANIDVGHGGTYWEPNGGEAAAVSVAWLEWILRGDEAAGRRFVGADCGLCVDARWSYEQKNLDAIE